MASNNTVEDTEELNYIFIPIWLLGISVSLLCFTLQALTLTLLPKSRKLDQKIIIQLTLARLIYSITEYMVNYIETLPPILVFLLFTVYQQIDLVLISWMCVFTKHLYNKIVIVFTPQKFYYLINTLLIWISTFFIGMLCPILINTGRNYYKIFYRTCAFAKLCVICYNVWLLFKIYSVVIKCRKCDGCEKPVKDVIKTCVVAFIIVTVSCLQVLTTDVLSFFYGANIILTNCFCVINSFQTIAITIIFMILVKSSQNQ